MHAFGKTANRLEDPSSIARMCFPDTNSDKHLQVPGSLGHGRPGLTESFKSHWRNRLDMVVVGEYFAFLLVV